MAKKKIKDELLDHNYDGIQELDNDLPPWWLWLFYFTIGFSFIYLMYYHVLDIGKLQYAEYEQEMIDASVRYAQTTGTEEPAAPATPLTSEADLATGKDIFMTNCMPCHGPSGEGNVGPNLTDDYWIHGGDFANIVNVINVGVPAKGMISWKSVLTQTQIRQVASYIKTLHGSNPPNGKAPEGELYQESE